MDYYSKNIKMTKVAAWRLDKRNGQKWWKVQESFWTVEKIVTQITGFWDGTKMQFLYSAFIKGGLILDRNFLVPLLQKTFAKSLCPYVQWEDEVYMLSL